MALGRVRHSRKKAHKAWQRATASSFQKARNVKATIQVYRNAAYPEVKIGANAFMADVCIAKRCEGGYGKSPTHAIKVALRKLSKKLK